MPLSTNFDAFQSPKKSICKFDDFDCPQLYRTTMMIKIKNEAQDSVLGTSDLVAVQKQLTVILMSVMHWSPIENPFTFFPISMIEPMALWPGMSCKKDDLLKQTI